MEKINKKIQELGGTELTNEFKNAKINNFDPTNYLKTNKLTFNWEFISFLENYGYHQFNKDVIFESIDDLPFSFDKNNGEVNFIYGWGNNEDSLQEIRETFLEQIPEKYFVFAEGNLGDQLCINVENQQIYYWHHESYDKEGIYLIAKSFEEFIKGLSIRESKEIDCDIEDEWFADDF